MISNKLGEFIRSKRGDMSLRDFAKLCGLSHTHLDSIEKGVDPRTNKVVRPTVDTLNKIANGSGLILKELIELSTGKDSGTSFTAPKIVDKKPKDLKKILEQHEIMFSGTPLNEDDKQAILDIVELQLFKRAKELNKRKKPSSDSLCPTT